MRPLTGITAWRRTLDTYLGSEVFQSLSAFYSDAVEAAGMTPVIFPNALDPGEADRLVGLVDGLVMSGGDDVDPASYQAGLTHSKRINPEVDAFEVALLQAARRRGTPVLAICRGLQMLNVALGGTLSQEVTSPGGVHELIDENTTPEEYNTRSHVVRFQPGSIIAGLYGADEAKVNTLHHQGIDELAPELIIEGQTDDGLVEAARFDGDWWALGVQWHPERMDSAHHHIFTALRKAIEGG